MEILIEHNNLVDFPYDPTDNRFSTLFTFDEAKVNNLVSEILYTNPTCYLVSGYRGSGKTSFIRYVKQVCKNLTSTSRYKEILFIYSSFSRFETKTFFLRKLIRNLRETVIRECQSKELNNYQLLKDLYNQTWNDVKTEHSFSSEKESSLDYSLDLTEFLKKLILPLLPVIGPIFTEIILGPLISALPKWVTISKIALYVASITWGIFKTIKFTHRYSIKRTELDKISASSITDDDTTEYFLSNVLDTFEENQVKLIFVLDELDKVEDSELNNLLKEMKPWLVRGKADFILVAGQKLTMKYYQLKERDDEILASLFSKIIHIDFLKEERFITIFRDLLFLGIKDENNKIIRMPLDQLEKEQAQLVYDTCNSLILKSKRLPRTFMNLLRQDLEWTNKEAFLPVRETNIEFDNKKMQVLKKIISKVELNANISETLKSHIIMQLFRVASFIPEDNLNVSYQNLFSIFLSSEDSSEKYAYPSVIPIFEPILTEFYQEAKGIIIKQTVQIEDLKSDIKDSDVKEKLISTNFIQDFTAFFDLLVQMQNEIPPIGPQKLTEDASIEELLEAYINKNVFSISDISSEPLKKNLKYYKSRLHDPEAFKELYEVFENQKISAIFLFQQLFERYTSNQIQKSFPKRFTESNDNTAQSSAFEKQVSDYKAEYYFNGQPSGINILFNYKFINGLVAISSDEIISEINNLDNYNLQMGNGNYLVSIIFYKSNSGIDSEKVALSTNFQIEKLSNKYKGKIQYFVISIFSFQELPEKLAEFTKSITPYSVIPQNSRIDIYNPDTKRSQKGSKPKFDPEDPQKGQWGGQAESRERQLSAIVAKDSSDLFRVDLYVKSTNSDNPLHGKVTFYLHDTFDPSKHTVMAKDGVARIEGLYSYEAFTVGATCDNNRTQLELDLNELDNIPEDFKYDNSSAKSENKKPSDATLINVREPWELSHWAKELGVTKDQILAAVKAVGTNANRVKAHLRKGKSFNQN